MATYNSTDDIRNAAVENIDTGRLFIAGEVILPLFDIVHLDVDSFYDRLADLLVDDRRLCDIDYDLVGTAGGDNVVLLVSGDVTDVLAERTLRVV